MPLADGCQALRARDRRRLALDSEALIIGHVHVALRSHQPNVTVHDGALASVDDTAVIVIDRVGDLSRLAIAHRA